ncbi:MAG TPA: MFS transporter [Candidatus Saccharimonadales bacterium]|nr:MFS transporter [Candidatus Saccharimonadales bacterium]
MEAAFKRTFSSFEVRNFRLFFAGQCVSLCGTWMQIVGMSWLVLQLTHSGTQLGLVAAAQFLPVLLFGVIGGVIADRFDKRHVLFVTQTVAALLSFALGAVVVAHAVQMWMVYVIAVGLGLTQTVDNPTRQTFVMEMVGRERLRNAVSLNSTMVNGARIIGPSIAGVLIATVGIGPCFLVNAASFVAIIVGLAFMRVGELHRIPGAAPEPGQIRAGVRYVLGERRLRAILLMMFIVGIFAYEFPVALPLFATTTLHGNASTYSALTVAMGIGAMAGGLYNASRGQATLRRVFVTVVLFGCSMVLLAAMPNVVSACVVLFVVGVLSIWFIALGNTTLQLTSDPHMRGRVMSLWAIAFFGTTPIGGPIIGYIGDHVSPRAGLLAGGLSAFVAAGVGYLVGRPKP